MNKLISHRTTEALPGGSTITTLHLTPEARRGLSTNGARILPPGGESSHGLTVYDHQQRLSKAHIAIHVGTLVAVLLALIGVQPVVCAMIPSCVVSITIARWARRDWQALKRRRMAREAGQ